MAIDPATFPSGLLSAVSASVAEGQMLLLAVSGGIDSMVLLSAAAKSLPASRLVVATFDHGTGSAATRAAEAVSATAARLGIECIVGRGESLRNDEASLRHARWTFLREAALSRDAVICTAHNRDDQVETVLMRVLRGAGARGLAGLYAESNVVRPLLDSSRADIMRYAAAERIEWVEDPTNSEAVYLRNRVRNDLLPALRVVDAALEVELLAIARRAAALRSDIASALEQLGGVRTLSGGAGLDVATRVLDSADAATLFWPPIAARVGLVLDRRAVARLADFTARSRVGARIQIAGGWQVVRSRNAFELRREDALGSTIVSLQLSEVTSFGEWSFKPLEDEKNGSPWTAMLPVDRGVTVRRWQAGDTIQVRDGGRAKKVKRLLSEAGVTGHNRAAWPVVLAGDQIVWIPGVCRAAAKAAPPGAAIERGLPFLCEHIYR